MQQGLIGAGVILALGTGMAVAQDGTESFFGNVRASDISSLSYEVRGCITEVSEEAERDRVVQAGQVVVRLDDLRANLALRTAEVRVLELEAAVTERQLALQSAQADELRQQQDLELVTKEFERSSVLMGRGLINESTMDAIERRFMESTFASDRSRETIVNAEAAIKRSQIALEIGQLERQSAEITLEQLTVVAPYDGVLVGFDANVGDCVQEGQSAARIYVPEEKSVDVFFRISRLTGAQADQMAVGAPVKVTRINGEECGGAITRIDTEADLESQFVQATVEVDRGCAPRLFLNEAVEVQLAQSN